MISPFFLTFSSIGINPAGPSRRIEIFFPGNAKKGTGIASFKTPGKSGCCRLELK